MGCTGNLTREAPQRTGPALARPQGRATPCRRNRGQREQALAQLGRDNDARRAADLILHDTRSDKLALSGPLLEHGDCHTENIVRDEHGAYRWIDWQEAHLGDGFGDLIFLWQRAEFDGADPPREAMTVAYTAARHLHLKPILRRALSLTELRLLFISWPPFLPYGTPENQQRMKEQLPRLIDTLS